MKVEISAAATADIAAQCAYYEIERGVPKVALRFREAIVPVPDFWREIPSWVEECGTRGLSLSVFARSPLLGFRR